MNQRKEKQMQVKCWCWILNDKSKLDNRISGKYAVQKSLWKIKSKVNSEYFVLLLGYNVASLKITESLAADQGPHPTTGLLK